MCFTKILYIVGHYSIAFRVSSSSYACYIKYSCCPIPSMLFTDTCRTSDILIRSSASIFEGLVTLCALNIIIRTLVLVCKSFFITGTFRVNNFIFHIPLPHLSYENSLKKGIKMEAAGEPPPLCNFYYLNNSPYNNHIHEEYHVNASAKHCFLFLLSILEYTFSVP